jgi:hypothetical protein
MYIGRGKTAIEKATRRMKLIVNQAIIDDEGLKGLLRGKCSLCMISMGKINGIRVSGKSGLILSGFL